MIGTGATAVQLIPELARRAADLTVYQRTPIWVVPKIDVRFGRLARGLFTRVPATQRAVRAITDAVYEFLVYVGVLRYDSVGRLNVAARVLAHVHRFASIRDRQVRRKLTPITNSAASDRRSPTPITGPSPSRTSICRPTGSSGSRPTGSSTPTAPRP